MTAAAHNNVYSFLGEAARKCAQQGFAVFPCKPRDKDPLTQHGLHDATTDLAQIDSWWDRRSDANIGWAIPPTLVVIDHDAYKEGGGAEMAALVAECGPLPPTKEFISGGDTGDGNSRHRIYRLPPGTDPARLRGKLGKTIDIKKSGGYIVLPPSVHPSGKQYQDATPDVVPVPLPDSWLQAALKPEPKAATSDWKPNAANADHPYVQAALASELGQLASMGPESGRNTQCYNTGISLGRFARIDREWLRAELIRCMEANGYIASDGLPKVEKTVDNAFAYADTQPPREIPDRDERGDAWSFDPFDAPGQPGEESSEQKKSGLRIDTLRGSEIKTRTAQYVWAHGGKGRIQRGTLTLFGGRPGSGKSTCSRWAAAQFTRGTLPGCWEGKPQNVAYVGSEESLQYTLTPGLEAAGADLDRVYFPVLRDDDGQPVRLMSARDERRLGDWLIDNDTTVLIVDPVMSTISGKVDINRNNEVRGFIEPWARIAERIDGVVIGVAHLNKAPTGDVVAGINGSSAFGEVARSVFGFAKDPDSEDGLRVMSQAKNSTGPEDLSLAYRIDTVTVTNDDMGRSDVAKFVLLGDSDRSVGDVLSGGMGRSDVDDDAVVWLRDYLMVNG